MGKWARPLVLVVTWLAPLAQVYADVPRFGASDVASVFFVAKSENKNQVHYGLRLDDACMPLGSTPVVPYWRMLERGPNEMETLASHEHGAYGVASQQVVSRDGTTARIRLALRALPTRTIEIEVSKRDGRCVATASLPIAGAPARLRSVYAQLKWPFGVAYI